MKPILFSTPMVKAILDGRKTQTRRIIKPQPILLNEQIKIPCPISEYAKKLDQFAKKGYTNIYTDGILSGMMTSAPKYEVGDILYVRETFCPLVDGTYIYKAGHLPSSEIEFIKWKPSLFMPKEYARIFLKVSDIRAERLQDISDEDSIAEGVKTDYGSYRHGFIDVWKSINGEQSWKDNPFLWVITFERTTKQ